MSKKILFGWFWAAVAAACFAGPAPAQSSPSSPSSQKPAQTFSGSAEVVEVAVPVQVVRGQPVRGLFRPPQLPPGEYVLRVTVNGAAGPAGTSSATFVVH
jgi:hypothetical protein